MRPHLQQCAVVVDDDVADLAGGEVVADEELAADDDAGADTHADTHEQQVLASAVPTALVLGEHGALASLVT